MIRGTHRLCPGFCGCCRRCNKKMPKAMPSSFRFNALCCVCILVAYLKVVVSFLPVPAATAQDVLNLQGHPLQTPTRRNRRCLGPVIAAGPPDDFIDTTFVEEEGFSYVGVDFERQELRVIFETMDKNNIYYKMLAEDQITEILQLTQALLSAKLKPIDISKLCEGDSMKGKWKLEFSTEERYKFLPPSADIYNYIYEGKKGGRLDNVIRFNKSWIVKSVRAITMYEMDAGGKIMFEFDRIEADLLGFKVPLPKLNSDAGFVEVQYFDGDLWIEAFELPAVGDSETTTVVNIYRRVGDATDSDKSYIPERTGEQRLPQR